MSDDCTVERQFVGPFADRYRYDFKECRHKDGWSQYDTDQDAWYFGVWVHRERREIVTYAEGDETRTRCHTQEAFDAEIARMNAFYKPAPMATAIDVEAGTVTHIYDEDALFGREVPSDGR